MTHPAQNSSDTPSSGSIESTGEAGIPKDLKVQLKEQRLRIEWSDGRLSDYSLDDLRRQCPCATCREERSKQVSNPLKILKHDPTNIRVTDAKLVGNYAIQFFWSDGHNTGIFDYRYLRGLDSGP